MTIEPPTVDQVPEPEPHAAWLPAIDRIVESGGVALIVGGVDTGKTTFCTLAVNTAVKRGRKISIVDSDIGQSEIGPPGCVGWGFPESPIRSLSDIQPAGLAFVGSTTPRGNLLEHVAATRAALDATVNTGSHVTLVDTTGFIHGSAARRVKHAKMAMLLPRHVVALQRKDECESLLGVLRYRNDVELHRLPVPPVVTRKSPHFRAQRRTSRFARCFIGSEIRYFAFENVVLTGTWLNAAPAVAPHLVRFIANSLRVRVYYAEERDRHLGIVTNAMPVGESGMAAIQEQFRTQAITVTPAANLRHLLVGLCDHNDRMLGLGLVEAIDLRRRDLGILTPIRAHAAVRIIHFGLLRVEATGKELGAIRPGEV